MWRILERKGKRDCKDLPSFLISLVSLVYPSPSPELQPCPITVNVTVSTDCPKDITCLLPLQGKLKFLGEYFHWSRHDSKVLPRTVKAIESPDWTRDFILRKVRFWWCHGASLTSTNLPGYERSHESRCWVGGSGRKHGVQKHEEGTKQKCMDDSELAEFVQERAAELVYLEWGGDRRAAAHWQHCRYTSEWKQEVVVEVWHVIRGRVPLSAQKVCGGKKGHNMP